MIFRFTCGNGDRSDSPLVLSNTMAYRIFSQRFQRESRYGKACTGNIVVDCQGVPETQLFDLQIQLRMLQFPAEGDPSGHAKGIQILTQIGAELVRYLRRLLRILPALNSRMQN